MDVEGGEGSDGRWVRLSLTSLTVCLACINIAGCLFWSAPSELHTWNSWEFDFVLPLPCLLSPLVRDTHNSAECTVELKKYISRKCNLYPSHVLAFPPAGPCTGQACSGWVCSGDGLWEVGEAFPTLSLCTPALCRHLGTGEGQRSAPDW